MEEKEKHNKTKYCRKKYHTTTKTRQRNRKSFKHDSKTQNKAKHYQNKKAPATGHLQQQQTRVVVLITVQELHKEPQKIKKSNHENEQK